MGEEDSHFVRTRSKVWWGNYQNEYDEEEEEDDWEARRSTLTACSASIASTDSDRGSSGSPESHRSQDSGFSDSDGSPPNMGGAVVTRIPRVTLTRAGKRSKEEDDGLSPSTALGSKSVRDEIMNKNAEGCLENPEIIQEHPADDGSDKNNNTPVKGMVMNQINKFEVMVTSIDQIPQKSSLMVLGQTTVEGIDNQKDTEKNVPDGKMIIKGNNDEEPITKNSYVCVDEAQRFNDSLTRSLKSPARPEKVYKDTSLSLTYSNSRDTDQSTDFSRFGERFKTQVEVNISSPTDSNDSEEDKDSFKGRRSLPASPRFQRNGLRKSVFGYLDDEPKSQSVNRYQEKDDSLNDKLKSLHVYLTEVPFIRNDSMLNRSLENTRISRSRMSPVSHTNYPKPQNLNRSFGGSESLPYDIHPEATNALQAKLSPLSANSSLPDYKAPLDVSNTSLTSDDAKYLGKFSSPNSSTWSIPGPPAHASTPKSPKTKCVKTPRSSRKLQKLNFDQRKDEAVPCPLISSDGDPPLNQWLKELRFMCDPECMTTLQSKSLTADLSQQVTVMAAVTTEAVRNLQHRTKLISSEFSKLYRQVDLGMLDHVGPLVQSLVGHITEFIQTCQVTHSEQDALTKTCEKLKSLAFSSSIDRQKLTMETASLGRAFTGCVDTMLFKQIKVLMTVIEDPAPSVVTLAALSSLTSLGLEGKHLSQLIARCGGGIRSLLTLCLDSKSVAVRTAALRTLATVCCSTHTIRQLEKAGGIDILTDILQDDRRPETELTESVSVIVQITAPWIEDNHSVFGLTQQLIPLVAALTRMVSNTTDSTTLLLCAAALSHLTQLEPQSIWTMINNSTIGTLLLAIRRQGPFASVFLREQAAGLLANMAAVPEARMHLIEHRAVVALLCFLQVRHSPLQHSAEISAAERLQHKSAIALSRMCTDQEVAAQVVELQGVQRLVKLCREERERNNSDGVLVACLAALRKIVANCGSKSVEELNALELVEPRLLDSFLIYSSRQESYV